MLFSRFIRSGLEDLMRWHIVLIFTLTLGGCVTGPQNSDETFTYKRELPADIDELFKILTPEEWEKFQQDRVFRGSTLDLKDGFIHMSYAEQYPQILKKFFKDRRPLILVKLNAKLLKPGALKVESNRPGGDKYPHIYGEIPFEAVLSHEVLEKK